MLGVGEFRSIFVADVVSMLGTIVAAVALTVLVYERTRSPALAALVMALSFVPYLVGGVLLGAAADRLPARRVLVGCDLASAVLVACMLIPGMPVPGLLALLFANGLISPVYQGVRSAVLPEVLPPGPPYVLGRALMRMVAQSAQIVGYGAGGLLLAILSPRGALAADVIAARLLAARMQRRIIVPAGLLVFAPLAAFAASPGLGLALGLLVISGLGSAWAAGIDGLLIDTAPPGLRNRALALAGDGLMVTQGAGFALWGVAGQYAPLAVVIPAAATAGGVAVATLRPHRLIRIRGHPGPLPQDSPASAALTGNSHHIPRPADRASPRRAADVLEEQRHVQFGTTAGN